MSGRQSRPRTRRSAGNNPVSNSGSGTSPPPGSPRVRDNAQPTNIRNRSRSLLDQNLPENWYPSRLVAELKKLNCSLPASTAHKTLVRVYKRLQQPSSSTGGGPSLAPSLDLAEVNESRDASVQDGVDLFPNSQTATVSSSSEVDNLRRDMASVQATLAEISRSLALRNTPVAPESSGTVNSVINASVVSNVSAPTCAYAPPPPAFAVTTRVAIDSLPAVNIVTSKVRNDIHQHKYVNLALLLIPGMDNNDQTQITDSAGTQIVVKATDARLNRSLTIHEFRVAFTRYADVVFEKQPERRKELSTYSAFIDQLYNSYSGTYFYDYHRAFARKVEQHHINAGDEVDWAFKDTDLYLQIFPALHSYTCENCQCFDHFSAFCPTLRDHTPSTARDHTPSTARKPYPARSFDSREVPAVATPSYNKLDVRGRKRIQHNGSELCNNFNAGLCNFRHTPGSRIVHMCSTCFAPQHSAVECPQRPAAAPPTSSALVPFSRK
jgi:hypothetical protein